MATALALAASMASGIKANFGTMTKPFHVGQSARNGLLAAMLAKEGMTANHGALEHKQGFFAVFNGAGTFQPERIEAEWAKPYELSDPGIAFKRHPCCGSTHPAADAMLHLRETHALSADRVSKIESWTHPRRLQHTNRPDPQSGLDGKFSIQYVLARALMHGIVSLEHFSDEAVCEDAARAVAAKVDAQPEVIATRGDNEHFYARVRVTTTAGEAFEHFVDAPHGRDRAHPLPERTLEAKFRDCAQRALDPITAESLVRLCGSLEVLADAGDVLSPMLGAAARIKPLDARRACA
jgi:2-methylcitrate dehydratase PrpD